MTEAPPSDLPATILVVDDQAHVREITQRVLVRADFAVLSARDGEDAYAVWQANRDRIALVLTDVVMPRVSGPEFVQRVRAIDAHVPVLFMSGYAQHLPEELLADRERARFLAKPFAVDELVATVRDLLARRAS